MTTLNLDELEALLAKATPGPWHAEPKRLVVNGQQGPIMSYLAGNAAKPEGMKVSLASERVADHQFVAALHNAAPTLIEAARREEKLREVAKAVVWFDWSSNDADAVMSIRKLEKALEGKE
jgi:hypothetical protein